MAIIHLVEGGFSVLPVGTYTFKVTKAEYKPDFGKVEVQLEASNGMTHKESYNLNTDGGIKAFSYMAKCALNDFTVTDIDPKDLVGHFFEADVVHDEVPSRDDPTKTMVFAKLTNRRAAVGFPEKTAPKAASTTPKSIPSLKDLLSK